jgi:hypothetical protein
MSNIKSIISHYEQIISLFVNLQSQIGNSLQIINHSDLQHNMEIAKTYFSTIYSFFEQIEIIKDNPDCVRFSQRFNFQWILNSTNISTKTIELKTPYLLKKDFIVGQSFINSNNPNRVIEISEYNYINDTFITSFPISTDKYINSDGSKNINSIYNIYSQIILYCFVSMNGIHHFFNHKTSLELDSIQVLFQCIGQVIDHFKKYSHKLIQYYELYLVKQG